MKYELIKPTDKARAKKLLASDDRDVICRTLVSVAMFEDDRAWAQAHALSLLVMTIRSFVGLQPQVLRTLPGFIALSTKTKLCRSCANSCTTVILQREARRRMLFLIFLLSLVGIVGSYENSSPPE
jgi:hypothetical protein